MSAIPRAVALEGLPVHPVAALFPMLPEDQLQQLADDIQVNGLQQPVVMQAGVLLDGRNRLEACLRTGVDPIPAVEYDGDRPVAFIISANVRRRQMNAGQLGVLGHRLAGGSHGGDRRSDQVLTRELETLTVAQVAQMIGVSVATIERARMIAEADDDLAEAVMAGLTTLTEALREVQHKAAVARTPQAPSGKYRVVYADPPWAYNDALAISKSGAGESYGPAAAHYPSMGIAELCALDIRGICEDDAVLFLWVTSPMLEDCFHVIRAWGFTYKASFVWDKVKHNLGHYNSVRHEFLLICVRGSCQPDVPKLVDSVQQIERKEHSSKPDEFRRIIDMLYPHGERIELFARSKHHGWVAWGQGAN